MTAASEPLFTASLVRSARLCNHPVTSWPYALAWHSRARSSRLDLACGGVVDLHVSEFLAGIVPALVEIIIGQGHCKFLCSAMVFQNKCGVSSGRFPWLRLCGHQALLLLPPPIGEKAFRRRAFAAVESLMNSASPGRPPLREGKCLKPSSTKATAGSLYTIGSDMRTSTLKSQCSKQDTVARY